MNDQRIKALISEISSDAFYEGIDILDIVENVHPSTRCAVSELSKVDRLRLIIRLAQFELDGLEKANHGSPYDRGTADSYYGRAKNPHYYPNGSYNDPLMTEKEMTVEQIQDYNNGFDDNERDGFFKEWTDS